MRFLVVATLSLFVGLAVASPIGQVEVTTTQPQDLLRSDLDFASDAATTVVVEILADDAAVTSVVSATERARQAVAAAGEDESNEDNEDEDATTAAPTRGSGSSAVRPKPTTAIPQPLANSSDFLAEYQFSSQFNLGPNEKLPLAVAPGQAQPVEQAVPQVGQVQPAPVDAAAQPVAQVAQAPSEQAAAPVVAPNANAAANAPVFPAATPLSGASPSPANPSNSSAPSVVAGGDDEDDAESEEETQTETPAAAARLQQQQAVEAQRVEESDSDNEITSDDITTVKSFADEYVYTVQQLGGEKRQVSETQQGNIPTSRVTSSVPSSSSLLVPFVRQAEQINTGSVSIYGRNISNLHGDNDFDSGILSDGEVRAVCDCGRLPFRVPIGSEAEINVNPWTVAIVRGGLIAGGRPHCAGVLINDRYVLSSASCMDGVHPNGFQVWLTAHNSLEKHHLNVGTSKINVQDVIVHPNYHRGSRDNDICLIKMTQPVDISSSSSFFTPVCLPSASRINYAGRYGMVFGWGQGRVSHICNAEVPILDNSVCKRDTRHGASVTDNMMCAGFLTPTAPVRTEDCLGDAGGPLTVQVNGRMSLLGITSWGYEFHHRGHNPTVYTKVAGYADWILHNTEDADWCGP